MPNLGAPELLIILVIVVLLFGAGRISEIGGALGKGVKEFRNASNELEGAANDLNNADKPGSKPVREAQREETDSEDAKESAGEEVEE